MSVPKFKIVETDSGSSDWHSVIFYDDVKIGSFWGSDPEDIADQLPVMINRLAKMLDTEIEILIMGNKMKAKKCVNCDAPTAGGALCRRCKVVGGI